MSKRTQAYNFAESLDRAKRVFEWKKESIQPFTTKKAYNEFISYIDNLVVQAQKELDSIPLGYRYTGTFYLKRAYSIPAESIKVTGTMYMREDLVSWKIEESDNDYANSLFYVRSIFKDKKMTKEFTRADCIEVFK
jgi:hypothetical protein